MRAATWVSPISRLSLSLLLFSATAVAASEPGPAEAEDRRALAAQLAAEHGLPADQILPLLSEAKYQQGIIDAITRPAEAKPWKAYRPIFLTAERIRNGRAFLAQHRQALDQVAADTGVPAELIVAILGVETSYGRITGSYRVLDALYTLGVHYPPRQPFFRAELGHVFALAGEEGLDLRSIKGSYAGAMGWGQFMPSSYRHYARDGDGDGRRDLFGSLPDVFASVANYFVAHGWQPGQPIAVPATAAEGSEEFQPALPLKPEQSLAVLGERGFRPERAVGQDLPATLISLDGEHGREHWIGFNNFYVISRYNRSPLYSLAVAQLAAAVVADAAGVDRAP